MREQDRQQRRRKRGALGDQSRIRKTSFDELDDRVEVSKRNVEQIIQRVG
jgi:hypothetical protein